MDTRTGSVVSESELKEHLGKFSGAERRAEKKHWRNFEIGEQLTVKGIRFSVHEVGDQRLVLKFAEQAGS